MQATNDNIAKQKYWQPLLRDKKNFLCELGFGTGSTTWQIVQKNPTALYLGIEVYRCGIADLLQKAEEHNLKNLHIIEHDAIEVLENMLPSNILDGLHVFSPDPWPKKRHHKRRLVNGESLNLFHRSLKVGGYLYFVTDWQDYAHEVEEIMLKRQTALWDVIDRDTLGWSCLENKPPQRPPSKFENKASGEGRKILELFSIKKRPYRLELTPQKSADKSLDNKVF